MSAKEHTINLYDPPPYPIFRVVVDGSPGCPSGLQACSWCGATTSDQASRELHTGWHLRNGDAAVQV